MDPDRWKRIEELFRAALDLDPAGRSSYLDGACGGDASLRREVDSLLACDEQAQSELESLVGGGAESFTRQADAVDAGSRIGAYTIQREVGRGGMGTVYQAVRTDGEFSKSVAIKLIKRGMDTDFVLRRFRQERQ